MSREPFYIAASQAANTTANYEMKVEADARIRRLKMKMFDGPEKDLQIRPLIKSASNNLRNMLRYSSTSGAKDYFDGNDQEWTLDMDEPIRGGETLIIQVTNLSATIAYDFQATVQVVYVADGAFR